MKNTVQEPEVLGPEEQGVEMVEVKNSALAQVTRGDVEAQVSVARRYPRIISDVLKEAAALVTLTEDTAESCIYGLPRGGKTLEGPSARFAEIMRYAWGNIRVQSMLVAEEQEFVVVRGMAWDSQKNVGIGADVKRRITDKNGKRYNADMIAVTTAAASVIAERNATLRQIPKALWEPVYLQARKIVAGDAKTLASRRQAMIEHFMKIGVTPEQVYAVLEIKGIEDITLDHMVSLRGFATAIKEGAASIESIFVPDDVPTKQVAEDIVSAYLKDVEPDELRQKIQTALAAKKLNSAKTSVLLKKFAGKPAELLADLTAAAQVPAAEKKADDPPVQIVDGVVRPVPWDGKPGTAQEAVSVPSADEVFGGGAKAQSAQKSAPKTASAADASF